MSQENGSKVVGGSKHTQKRGKRNRTELKFVCFGASKKLCKRGKNSQKAESETHVAIDDVYEAL